MAWTEVVNRLGQENVFRIYSKEIENNRIGHVIALDVMKEYVFSSVIFIERDGVVLQILIRSEG